jgi:hypothetical protein
VTTLNPRLLAVLAVIAAAGIGLFAYTRFVAKDDTSASPSTPQASSTVKPGPTTKAASKVVLLPGLPGPVAGKLRHSKVVVVTVYQGATPDDLRAISTARKGARSVGAGFLSVNLANEKQARALAPFVGAATPPSLVVVKRPGTIVTRLTGPVDSDLVAQAAFNAGARRR